MSKNINATRDGDYLLHGFSDSILHDDATNTDSVQGVSQKVRVHSDTGRTDTVGTHLVVQLAHSCNSPPSPGPESYHVKQNWRASLCNFRIRRCRTENIAPQTSNGP